MTFSSPTPLSLGHPILRSPDPLPVRSDPSRSCLEAPTRLPLPRCIPPPFAASASVCPDAIAVSTPQPPLRRPAPSPPALRRRRPSLPRLLPPSARVSPSALFTAAKPLLRSSPGPARPPPQIHKAPSHRRLLRSSAGGQRAAAPQALQGGSERRTGATQRAAAWRRRRAAPPPRGAGGQASGSSSGASRRSNHSSPFYSSPLLLILVCID